MRLRKGGRRKHTPDMNMTPMIDVVFQLLIFFMVGLQVSKINAEKLELPQLAGAEEQKEKDLTINVNQAGQVIVSGKELTRDGVAALINHAAGATGEDPTPDNVQGVERLTVVLRVDRRSACKPVNELVADLSRMGIKHVRIAVQVPER